MTDSKLTLSCSPAKGPTPETRRDAPTALELLHVGYSVIPVRADKKPAILTWKEFQSTPPTPELIKQWTTELNPAGWAIVTGSVSQIITFDFDGEIGVALAKQWGVKPHRTTGSGGRHLDVIAPEDWRVRTINSKSKRSLGAKWSGLDLRGEGGYAIAIGRNGNGTYQWLRDLEPDQYEVIPDDVWYFLREASLDPESPWKKEAREDLKRRQNRSLILESPNRVDAEVLVRSALQAATHGRNNAGFGLACQLRDNGFSKGEAQSTMEAYRARVSGLNAKGKPEPYSLREAMASLESAYSQSPREPWSSPKRFPSSRIAKTPQTISAGWTSRLIVNGYGRPWGNVSNAITALRYAPEWVGVLHLNESSLNVVAKNAPPFEPAPKTPFDWSDEQDVQTAAWLQQQGIPASKEVAGQAIQVVARYRTFHPVRDYLDTLQWDGIQRIDGWLATYLGAPSSDYTKAVGAKWLISAIARVYKPGAKVDTCLILEGPQGTLKSTALRTLAGDDFFTDDISDLGSKDSVMQTRGVWIIELSELDSMARAEVSRIKAFVSRKVDRVRLPYGKHLTQMPRECVFAGTTNKDQYLKDETGNRRFWPVYTGKIDVAALARDRDQLWAEARVRFHAGGGWWLDTPALEKLAAAEQRARYEVDPWEESIRTWIANDEDHSFETKGVSISEILANCLSKKTGDWTEADQKRVGRCLRAMGWKRRRMRAGANKLRYRFFPSGSPSSPSKAKTGNG